MAIEELVTKLSDQVTKALMDGTASFKSGVSDPRFTLKNENITFVVYARMNGALIKTSESSTEISKDRKTVKHTGEQFERGALPFLEFHAEFGGERAGWYDLGKPLAVPDELDEKFAKKIDKQLTKALQKYGIIQ